MKVPGEGAGWQRWVVKVLMAFNGLCGLFMFRLPSGSLPEGLVAPVNIWFLGSSLFASIVFVTNLVRKLRHDGKLKPGWASLAVDAVLILGWWAAVVYLLFMALMVGIAGVPA